MKTVKLEFSENIAIIKLNRPESLNALSAQLVIDLREAIQRSLSEAIRCVLITGEGKAFCSGGDLREMKMMWEKENKTEAFLEEHLYSLHELILLIRESSVPFVAAVNGISAGAGTNIALACDIVIASTQAAFNEAFIKIGLSPDCGGSFFLPRSVGEKRAAELFMLGETISAQKALEIGVINRLCSPENLMQEALEIAKKLAEMPTASIARIKKLLNESFSNSLREQLQLEHDLQLESGRGEDFKEGVRAFFEKRKPNFIGR